MANALFNQKSYNSMTEQKKQLSFRFPVHQSPSAIAYSYTYDPYISLKIDGIFKDVVKDDYKQYFPIFPDSWTKIEGEIYSYGDKSILYVFFIEVNDKQFNNLFDMYTEIKNYFENNCDNKIIFKNHIDVKMDMIDNIDMSYKWVDMNIGSKLLWFPKKYWKLNTSNWNNYIDQLDSLFKFVNSDTVKSLINHDGLVITPNCPSFKKSLVKLKPRNDMTIDLFFNGKKFFSKERNDYTNIIGKYRCSDYQYGSVYRLAPNNGFYLPVYKREQGKKPNPDNIIQDILYKYYNYFEISQLKNLYNVPWYSPIIKEGLNEMEPVFNYTQYIYNNMIAHMNYGNILDIGCGSMGQYYRQFLNPNLKQYVGVDIDLSKLHEAQLKVSYDQRFKFMLLDITTRWNRQNECFPNNIWNTYYHNMVKLNQKFDNIISIFSSQYANVNKTTWNNYINEINFRSHKGTQLFVMWVDYTRIKEDSIYYRYDGENNIMTINLPHHKIHTEPGLGQEIIEILVNTHIWEINNKINIIHPPTDNNKQINKYIELIGWIILTKL